MYDLEVYKLADYNFKKKAHVPLWNKHIQVYVQTQTYSTCSHPPQNFLFKYINIITMKKCLLLYLRRTVILAQE